MATTLHAGRFLALVERDGWEYCERTNATGVVTIAALGEGGELLLVEQYRPPLRASVIELPAGLAGDEPDADDETLAAAAARELAEETGHAPEALIHVGRGPSSAGLTSELIDFFVAPRTTRIGSGGGTGNEEIIVHEIPLDRVPRWLEERTAAGCLVDPKVQAGLWFLERHLARRGNS